MEWIVICSWLLTNKPSARDGTPSVVLSIVSMTSISYITIIALRV